MAETTEVQTPKRARPRTRVGIVTSNKMQKTVVVAVTRRAAHPQYGKVLNLRVKYKAHVEDHEFPKNVTVNEGDKVLIGQTRPLSRDKCWTVLKVLEKAK
ncbi:MAG: 30S ribosomal protein S17 [Cystobacterineae bacterium]|nr:30S ribosomal protein S17 [Cystobacterineae bacterium]